MTEHLAVKRLTDSDLTFFHYHHLHAERGGNQQTINLNADVFIERLFPGLPAYAGDRGNRIRIAFHLFGPGAAPEMVMSKHIITGEGYKNWRLNGATIRSPDEDPERFTRLRAGDLAVFNFIGGDAPTEMRACLISCGEVDEADLHASLNALFDSQNPRRSMIPLSGTELERILGSGVVPDAHPLRSLSFPQDIPEVALAMAVRAGRRMTGTEIENMRKRQAQLGAWGEELGNQYLSDLVVRGEAAGCDWASRRNAASPFDFSYANRNGDRILLDVKSTSGVFEKPFHISWAELELAAASPHYHIWRFSDVDAGRGRLHVCENIRPLAQRILTTLAGTLAGVTLPGVIVHPVESGLDWSQVGYIALPGPQENIEEMPAT